LSGINLDKEIYAIDFEGLSKQAEFYQPRYETQEQLRSRIPDFRTVLYWNPEITTSTSGEASVNFFTSDEKGKYIGVIHGLTKDGRSGTSTFSFEVR
jgi:hypothetical protein